MSKYSQNQRGLVLSRKLGERIFIGNDIIVTVADIDRGKIRLHIAAPLGVSVDREEVRFKKDVDSETQN